MLVLSRGKDQAIVIGDNIVITVLEIRGNAVRLGIESPDPIKQVEQEEEKECQSP